MRTTSPTHIHTHTHMHMLAHHKRAMNASWSTGLTNTCPISCGLASQTHRKTVSLVPRLTWAQLHTWLSSSNQICCSSTYLQISLLQTHSCQRSYETRMLYAARWKTREATCSQGLSPVNATTLHSAEKPYLCTKKLEMLP